MADFLGAIRSTADAVVDKVDKAKTLIELSSTLKDFRQSGDTKALVHTMVSLMPDENKVSEEVTLKLLDEINDWDLNDQALVSSRPEVAALKRLVDGYTPYTNQKDDGLIDKLLGKLGAVTDNVEELVTSGETLMDFAMQRVEELTTSEVAIEAGTNESLS